MTVSEHDVISPSLGIALVALLAASLALNVGLGWRLRTMASESKGQSTGGLQTGAAFPPVAVTDLDGHLTTLPIATSKPTILYVFSPTCDWCAANLNSIKVLFRNASKRYNFVGLSLSARGLSEYARRTQMGFPVYAVYDATPSDLRQMRLEVTPQTAIISGDTIAKAWIGAYRNSHKAEIEGFFRIQLPSIN